jgi:DNA-binding response OmpR family regulator
MKTGAVEFLTKAFSDKVLLDAIRKALDRSRTALAYEAETRRLRNSWSGDAQDESRLPSLAGENGGAVWHHLGFESLNTTQDESP